MRGPPPAAGAFIYTPSCACARAVIKTIDAAIKRSMQRWRYSVGDTAMTVPDPLNPIRELMALHAVGRFAEMEARARAALKVKLAERRRTE